MMRMRKRKYYYLVVRGGFNVNEAKLLVEWIPVEVEITVELFREEPLVLDEVFLAAEDQLVLRVLEAGQHSRAIPHHAQRRLAVNRALHFLSRVVKVKVREPDLLSLLWPDVVHAGLCPQVVVDQPAVHPAEDHRELRPVGGEDGVQPGDGVQPQADHDGELLPVGWREELVVAGVDLYHSTLELVRGVLAVRLPVTPRPGGVLLVRSRLNLT